MLDDEDFTIWLDWLDGRGRGRRRPARRRPRSTPTSSTPTPREQLMSSRIELQGVGQVFHVRNDDDRQLREFVALDDLNLEVEAGEFVTLVGPSGLRQVHRARPGQRTDAALDRGGARRRRAGHRARPGPQRGLPAVHAAALAHRARATSSSPSRPRAGLSRPSARARGRVPRAGRAHRLREPLPARALRRHEAARGDRPQPVLRARGAADGRAVRRARRPDPRAAPGGAGADLAAHRHDDRLHHPRHRGGRVSSASGSP